MSPSGFTFTRTCGTRAEAASVSPAAGDVASQEPPRSVEVDVVHGICPEPALRMSIVCGAGEPPPSTAKKESPVSGMRSVWVDAVMVIVTGTLIF